MNTLIVPELTQITGGGDDDLLYASFQNGRDGGRIAGQLIAEGISIAGWVIGEIGIVFGL